MAVPVGSYNEARQLELTQPIDTKILGSNSSVKLHIITHNTEYVLQTTQQSTGIKLVRQQ